MILSSFVIQFLLYTCLICYNFDITNGANNSDTWSGRSNQSTTTTTKRSSSEKQSIIPSTTTTSPIISVTLAIEAEISTYDTEAEISIEDTEAPSTMQDQSPANEEKASLLSSTLSSDVKNMTFTITIEVPPVPVTIINDDKTNSTHQSNRKKSLVPIVLVSIFGILAIIVLILCIITYILIKQGYIKVFNQSRTRRKDVEQTRIVDSSSTIDNRSSPRR